MPSIAGGKKYRPCQDPDCQSRLDPLATPLQARRRTGATGNRRENLHSAHRMAAFQAIRPVVHFDT